jgi:hypothetical protein
MQQSEVQVISCTFKDLLDAHLNGNPILNSNIKGQLVIPEYQRPYVWKEKQINRLLNDLVEYNQLNNENKPLFYLGSIILHQDGEQLKIIDGQQRITTMLMLGKLKSNDFIANIEYKTSTTIFNIKKNLAYLKAVKNKDVFEYTHSTIFEELDFSKINITLVVTATEDLAYTFFETQNTGGVRLSGSDIIKAHHLRAIKSPKITNYQARRWELIDNERVEHIIQYLTKVRYWDNRNWKDFPVYKDEKGIKSELLDEFTERTLKEGDDISYYYSAVKLENGRQFQMHESIYKQLKQPLLNGNNTMDYINEYINLYEILFNPKCQNHLIPDEFYNLVSSLIHGHSGTIFLKELFELSIMAYVSRFGFYRIFESSLWIYRFIYHMRVSSSRNVQEKSVFKMIRDNQFIDNILEVYMVDQLINYLKRFNYNFNSDYAEEGLSKDKHLCSLRMYFGNGSFENIKVYQENPSLFDKHLVQNITNNLKMYNESKK